VAEDHVSLSAVKPVGAASSGSAQNDIVVSIVIEIARPTDAVAQLVAEESAQYSEPCASRSERRQINSTERCGVAVPEDDVARSCLRSTLWVSPLSTEYHIVSSVSVHISRAADRITALVAGSSAVYPEARAARGEGGQVNVRPAAGLAEDHNGTSGIGAQGCVVSVATNNEVIYAILVEVSRATEGVTPVVVSNSSHNFNDLGGPRSGHVNKTGRSTGCPKHEVSRPNVLDTRDIDLI
jgi:hypothetical protein